jgi:excisionase family DNA binding protein
MAARKIPANIGVPDLLTPTQAAKRLKLTRQGIAKAIKEGHLEARRYGRMYLIEPSALERYRATRKPPGRPPGNRKEKTDIRPDIRQ